MRKIINDPQDFVAEVIDGVLLAHGDELRAVTADRRAIVSRDAGSGGHVGIVTGGGSGHLPLFLGFVGEGLATGVAVGNVFSSPSAAQICAATVASDDGAGVLYLYGNYGGDVYNFGAAAEQAQRRSVRVRTVVGTDDVLSADRESMSTRRGVAGLFFALKTAGGAAARGDDLDVVSSIAQRTVDRTRTMGVGLAPTILPTVGEPSFALGEGEMEIGIGIHGEPGGHRGPLETADQIADRFLTEILAELPLQPGERVAVLVNGLGATPLEELYLIYRYVHAELNRLDVEIAWRFVGELVTSLEMTGASLSVLHLDDELAELVDAPAHSPFFHHRPSRQRPDRDSSAAVHDHGTSVSATSSTAAEPPVRTVSSPGRLRALLLEVTARLPDHADDLGALDAILGDGDLGVTIASGARAVGEAIQALPENTHPAELLGIASEAFSAANPSTYAALIGGGLAAMATTFDDTETLDAVNLLTAVRAAQHDIMRRGAAELGDKTVVDVLDAVAGALAAEAKTGADAATVVDIGANVALVAASAVQRDTGLQSRRGRAAWLGERSKGEVDPGSRAMQRIVEEVAAALRCT